MILNRLKDFLSQGNSILLSTLIIGIVFTTAIPVKAQWTSHRPDGHAPIGVMADHTHGKSEWMVGYKALLTYGQRNLNGTQSVSLPEIFEDGYVMASKNMLMQMHMLEIMYASTNNLTLMLMVDFMIHNMEHAHAPGFGEDHSHNTVGLSDLSLTGLYKFYDDRNERAHIELGFTIPTGRYDFFEGYNMQLGTGTVDVISGLTYLLQNQSFSYGAQLRSRLSFYENSRGYRHGNKHIATIWGGYMVNEWFSPLLRIEYNRWSNIKGRDPQLDQAIDPARDPNLQGGDRIDLGIGTNFYIRTGSLKGVRIAVEVLAPIYQNLDGPQISQDVGAVFGVQYAF